MFPASLISFIQILHNSLIVINGLVPHFHFNNTDSTNKIHSDSHLITHFSFLLEGFFLISFLSPPLFSILSPFFSLSFLPPFPPFFSPPPLPRLYRIDKRQNSLTTLCITIKIILSHLIGPQIQTEVFPYKNFARQIPPRI